MNKQFTLNVSPREGTGRSASRRLRKQNRIPAILYGKHTAPVTLSIDGPEFTRLLKGIGDTAALIELKGAKDASLSFLREVQRDPITDRYLHVDLHEVKADEKMEINVPVHAVGESTGVKNEAGVIEFVSHTLRIRCLPKDLPPFITVDVTELHVGQTIHLGEIKPLPGIEFLGDRTQSVVSCVKPVEEIVEVVAAPEAAVEGAPVEGAPVEGAAAAPGAAVPAAGAAAPAAAGAKGAAVAPAKGAAPAVAAKGAAPAPGAAKPGAPAAPAAKGAPPAKK